MTASSDPYARPAAPCTRPAAPGTQPASHQAPPVGGQPVGPQPPSFLNGATVHGLGGVPGLRHPVEMPLVWVSAVVTVLGYLLWTVTLVWMALTGDAVEEGSAGEITTELHNLLTDGGIVSQVLMILPVMPIVIWIVRALLYAQLRGQGVQMSPTQFPEGYRMVVEAAQAFGMRRVPDAYVLLGNGQINAFAAGHGFRRFVVVYSDLFEVGGAARDPQALRFVISHEVGHLAAGHVGYVRLLFTQLAAQVPLLGPALSRAQEYTADNHGYALAPQGVPGVMGLLAAGKYLGSQVNLHALADRATREKGFWLHLSVWMASHPVTTWRAHALRDRRRPGRLMFRPQENTAWFPPVQPAGSLSSGVWPTPAQVLAVLDATRPQVTSEEQFGRYPGVHYDVPRDVLRLADPRPRPRNAPQPQPQDPAQGSAQPLGPLQPPQPQGPSAQ